MTGVGIAGLAIGLAALASAVFFYLRSGVRARAGLLGARVLALLLLLALLIDPALPGEDPAFGSPAGPSHWVLVDPDPALGARADEGPLWEEMLRRAAEEADAGTALARLSGSHPEGTTPGLLEASAPAEVSGEIGPGLIRLAEGGADSLTLLSTLRVAPTPVLDALSRLPVPLRVIRIGGEVRNAAVAELRLPDTAPADEPLAVQLRLVGEGGGEADSVALSIEARPVDGEPVVAYEGRHPLPAAGSSLTLDLTLPPPPGGGAVRYAARVALPDDAFAADDERVAVVRVGEFEGGVVLVSLRPDWEPRTLLPVLERVTGLEGEGFLRVGPDRFLPLRAGAEPFEERTLETVVARARSAALLVIHGAETMPEGPLGPLASSHPRTLHLPAGPGGASPAGVEAGGPLAGEWTPAAEAPASPVAAYLSGLDLAALPPLSGLITVEPRGTRALDLRRSPGDPPVPGLLLVERGDGRAAVALARDFWRWGMRDGMPREAYRNLWAGVSGWLLGWEGPLALEGIRPEEPVLPRGLPLAWVAPGRSGAALAIEIRPWTDVRSTGPLIREDRVRVGDDDRFTLPPLPPGEYRYRVRVEEEAPEPDVPPGPAAEGTFEVEVFQDALLRLPLDPDSLMRQAEAERPETPRAEDRRGLRTHPLPWLLLLGLLSIEWIGRRRAGLR